MTCARRRDTSPLLSCASSALFLIGKISPWRPSKFRMMSLRSACERVNVIVLFGVIGSTMATMSVGWSLEMKVVSARRSGMVTAGSRSMW